MADALKRVIYHEKQESGSMLCAQHALNSLLQQPIFTALDLASIAQKLDTMEQSYDENNQGKSTNMDDSGFFSIQVLENALQVWGLTLVRWRSEAMSEYQDRPYTQLGFILNLEEHWFTLRRFGPAEPDLSVDPGIGHWFNLNSCVDQVEWVSRTYLGMVLQQAEAEGYSVFAVTQIDPLAPLALPRTKADELASEIPEITTASTRISTSRTAVTGTSKSSRNQPAWGSAEGLEDEDMALQAALFASVMGESSGTTATPLPTRPQIHETPSDPWEIRARPAFSHPSSVGAGSTPIVDDSLETSARRAREELARFQEEQRQALAERLESDEMISTVLGRRQEATTATSPPRRRAPRPRREDEEEEEMMRRAIEASKKEAKERGGPEDDDDADEDEGEGDDHEATFEEDDMDLDDDDEEERAEVERLMQQRRNRIREEEDHNRMRLAARSTSPGSLPLTGTGLPEDLLDPFGAGLLGQNAAHLDNRIYDDEDAELQAALKASLEGAPADILIPPPPPPAARAPTVGDSSRAGGSKVTPVTNEEEEEEEEEESEEEEEEEVPPPKNLTAEEMRKARLARFGG